MHVVSLGNCEKVEAFENKLGDREISLGDLPDNIRQALQELKNSKGTPAQDQV